MRLLFMTLFILGVIVLVQARKRKPFAPFGDYGTWGGGDL
jgi:hypothetical protein